MPSIETTISFFGLSLLLCLTPGPGNVFVLLHSAIYGRIAGIFLVLGLCSGLVLYSSAVALGLAALFATSAFAFTVLKWCGASYLVYLSWQAFHSPVGAQTSAQTGSSAPARMYLRGIVMTLTNPKIVFFFLAFLPQFTAPEQGNLAAQLLWLGLVFIVATLVVFGLIVYFSGAFGVMLQRSARAQRILNWLAGSIFLGFAVRLIYLQR